MSELHTCSLKQIIEWVRKQTGSIAIMAGSCCSTGQAVLSWRVQAAALQTSEGCAHYI